MTPIHEVEQKLPVPVGLAVELPLYAALAFAPFAFGAAEAWSQRIVLGLVFSSLLALVLGRLLLQRSSDAFWTIAYVPVALLLLIVGLQLLPLPEAVIGAISPRTTAIRESILAVAGIASPARSTLSLYPLATERELRLWLGGAAVFVVVSQYYAPGAPGRLRRLLSCIAAVGLAVAGMALWQNFAHSHEIYGSVTQAHPMSGPFANHSHFGQFLNLSIGAGIALLMFRWVELRRRGYTWAGIGEELRRPGNWDISLLVAFLVAAPVTVMLSLTRGGTLSMFVAAATLLAVMPFAARRRRLEAELDNGSVAAGLLIGLAVFALLAAVGFNVVYDRLATLRHVDHATGNRVGLIQTAVAVAKSFPIVGAGLGTHAFVYPMFDATPSGSWATYAENEYAQLLEEVGVAGLGLLACFAVCLAVSLARGIRAYRTEAGPTNGTRAALPGLMFGLVAVALHSWSDFGQHLPAVGFLTAVICGLIVRLGRPPAAATTVPATRTDSPSFALRPLFASLASAAAIVALGAWAWTGVSRDRDAEAAWISASENRTALDARGWELDSPSYRALIEAGNRAVAIQPRDVEYAFWLNSWYYVAVAQQTPESGELDEQLAGWSQKIADDLKRTAALCPTFGRPLAFAGAIELRLDPTSSAARSLIERGAALASYDAESTLTASRVAAADGRRDEARALLLRAVAAGTPVQTAIDELVDRIRDPDAAIQLTGTDVLNQRYLADRLAADSQFSNIADAVRSKYATQLEMIAARSDAPTQMLDQAAELSASRGEFDRAIELLQRAVAMEYGNVDRRMRLAQLLWQQNNADRALEQARICLRIRPGWPEAEKLVSEASVGRGPQVERSAVR